jgi:putative FmdB family regulatory protein
MPIYEFRCARCGALSEVVQRVGERPPPCPKCGSRRMARAVSRTSFQLKGGGWHADLYATPRPGKAEGAESATPPAEKPAAPATPGASPTPGTSAAPESSAAPASPSAGSKPSSPEAPARSHRRRPSSTKRRR